MSNKTFDLMKWGCIVVAPAINVLITTLNSLWGWNLPIEAITGTLSAIALFIGALLGFSNMQYKKNDNLDFEIGELIFNDGLEEKDDGK